MTIETELKLSLSAAAARRLPQHPLLATLTPQRQQLTNCYYDTADFALLRAGVAVRHRRTAGCWLLTVKTAEPAAGGLARRNEWEAPSQPDTFDFSQVDDKRLRKRLQAWQADLRPAFTTDFLRTTWLIEPAAGVRVELALDRGCIRHGEQQAALHEVELELLAGPVSALFEIARALQAALPLRPELASKAERGYQLCRGEAPQPVRAGRSPVAAAMSPLTAFRAVAFDCLEHLLRNEAGVRAGDDPEFVHQARVAVRRLRSALRLWAPLLPAGFLAAFAPAWQQLGQTLGAARDEDVFATQLLPPLADCFPGHPVLAALQKPAARRRERRQRALRAAFAAPLFGRLVLEFSAALHALPEFAEAADTANSADSVDSAPLAHFARRQLRRLARKAERQASVVASDALAEHQLRIAIKQLRYALEFLAPLLARRPLRGYLAAAAELQALLGALNDIDVAEALIAGDRPRRGGELVAGWFAGRARLLRERLPAVLAAWARLPAPWAGKATKEKAKGKGNARGRG